MGRRFSFFFSHFLSQIILVFILESFLLTFSSCTEHVCCTNEIFCKNKVHSIFILLINPPNHCSFISFFFLFWFSLNPFSCLSLPFLRTIQFLDNGEDRGVAFELSEEDISQTLYPAVSFASPGHRAIMRTKDGVMLKPAKH